MVRLPTDHVLNRAFYLINDAPGGRSGHDPWIQDPRDGENDGVSPIIVGGNNWAAAWALDKKGKPLHTVTPGGEAQRERALSLWCQSRHVCLNRQLQSRSGPYPRHSRTCRTVNGSALNIIASPPIAENWLWVLGLCAALALIALALWRPRGGMWRALAIAFSLAVLFGPAVSVEQRESKPDIALIIVDRTTSQNTGQRPDQTGAALETLETQLAQWPDVEWQVANVRDDPTAGSRLFTAISEHMGTIPQDQRAGVIMITDGQAHDTLADVFLDTTGRDGAPTPVHVLLTGDPEEHDRRLVIEEAPRFGIVNRTARVEVRLEDAQDSAPTELTIKRDDQPLLQTTISPGERRSFDLPITRRGDAMFTFSVATPPQDIAPANNQAFVPIRGVRERLRVLLVSGKPYAGTRVWRDLLKSDPSVDLVHFTILRSPDKQSFIAQNELSLISFPTQELFEEKLKEFDLVVFDGYWQRGLLTRQYLRNVADYVRAGGALLEVAGPYSATSLGLGRSGALGDVLTARTTGRVMVGDFRPQLTQLGARPPGDGWSAPKYRGRRYTRG